MKFITAFILLIMLLPAHPEVTEFKKINVSDKAVVKLAQFAHYYYNSKKHVINNRIPDAVEPQLAFKKKQQHGDIYYIVYLYPHNHNKTHFKSFCSVLISVPGGQEQRIILHQDCLDLDVYPMIHYVQREQ